MRNSYLEFYYNIIPEIQQNRLLEILKKQYDDAGITPDDITIQARLEFLISELKIPLGDPQIQYRKAEKYSKISSKDYNNMMEEVFVDLGALFKQNNIINETIKVHELLNDAVLRDVRAALRKVENDVTVYKIIKENKTGITDAKYNTFYKDDNRSNNLIYKAWHDSDTDSIKLPVGVDHSALSINGLAMAEIVLFHYGGGIKGTLESEEHRKEKAIDESKETFWGEVILTDEPIRQTYENETQFGAICEVVIELFRAELINHIKYMPFTSYPLTILRIEYREKNDTSWVGLDITSQSSTTAMEFNFSEVLAKEVKIVINQKNPSINTYKLPKRLISNAELWQQIADREYSISTDTTAPIQATQDMIDYVGGWQAYVDALDKYEDRLKDIGEHPETGSIAKTMFEATTDQITETSEFGADELKLDLYGEKSERKEEMIEIRKYEYVYGAYNIDVKRMWYIGNGEYISPKYITDGAVMEASLGVTDVVPSGTTIEYQVSTRDEQWKNITPTGIYIYGERLDVDPNTQEGILRFTCADGYPSGVYRDGELMPSGISTDPSGYFWKPSTKTVVVGSGWYIPTSIYTVDYDPLGRIDVIPSGVLISFANDTLIESDETFIMGGTREYKVELFHNPYIRYEIINDTSQGRALPSGFLYSAGRWQNSGGEKYGIAANAYYDPFVATVDGYSSENRTDYYEDVRPALTQYDAGNYPYFEYFSSDKNLYFNTQVTNREVRVIYDYLNDYIQFRALLRNNQLNNVTNTPVLEDYTLKLRTL